MDMKRQLILVLGVVGVLTVGVAAYYRSASGSEGPSLTTAPVSRGSVVETVAATGALEAVTTVQVGTQVSGTIKALHADYNSTVRKGQVIAELEPSLFETQVEGARATVARLEAERERARVQLADANLKLRRARELAGAQLIATSDFEAADATARQAAAALNAAEAQVVQARASLNQTQVNLGHTVIRAPIDGVVISRSVDVGQTVAASMQAPTLFVLANDLKHMQVNASVDEADIGRVRPGQRVEFRVDAYPAEAFAGTVRQVRLEPVIEQNVVSYVTVIDVPNPRLLLRPGMTATVNIEVQRVDNALRVPSAALRFQPTAEVFDAVGQTSLRAAGREGTGREARSGSARQARVWVLKENRLVPIAVRASVSDGATTAVIAEDLGEGDRVVTATAAAGELRAASAATASPLLPRRPGANRSGQGGRR
jgi:HlyD family secretion protein